MGMCTGHCTPRGFVYKTKPHGAVSLANHCLMTIVWTDGGQVVGKLMKSVNFIYCSMESEMFFDICVALRINKIGAFLTDLMIKSGSYR